MQVSVTIVVQKRQKKLAIFFTIHAVNLNETL